ncbi:MAG TPA: MBL fold metallo-hydrolase, partial [Sediminibacterium sp.]
MLSVLAIIALVIFAVRLFMQGAAFGGIATDERKERMLLSPNYRNAAFRNQHLTPSLAKGVGFFRIL